LRLPKPTLIAQITLIAQRGPERLVEFHLRDLRHQRDLRPLLEEPLSWPFTGTIALRSE
jgi:hypothetical protein